MSQPLIQKVGQRGPPVHEEKSHLESIWVLIGIEQEAGIDLLRAPREKF